MSTFFIAYKIVTGIQIQMPKKVVGRTLSFPARMKRQPWHNCNKKQKQKQNNTLHIKQQTGAEIQMETFPCSNINHLCFCHMFFSVCEAPREEHLSKGQFSQGYIGLLNSVLTSAVNCSFSITEGIHKICGCPN